MPSGANSRHSTNGEQEVRQLCGENVEDLDHLVERLLAPAHRVEDIVSAIRTEEISRSTALSHRGQPLAEGLLWLARAHARATADKLAQGEALRPAPLLSNGELTDVAPRHGHDQIRLIKHPGLDLHAAMATEVDASAGPRVDDLCRRWGPSFEQPGRAKRHTNADLVEAARQERLRDGRSTLVRRADEKDAAHAPLTVLGGRPPWARPPLVAQVLYS